MNAAGGGGGGGGAPKMLVLPLHSTIPAGEQKLVFDRPPPGVRRALGNKSVRSHPHRTHCTPPCFVRFGTGWSLRRLVPQGRGAAPPRHARDGAPEGSGAERLATHAHL